MNMKKILVVAIIVIAVLFSWWLLFRTGPQEPAAEGPEFVFEEPQRAVTVNLVEQNDSGISGTATIAEVEDGIRVVLDLTGTPQDIAQPAHIHYNTCEEMGEVLYALESPVNGFSQTLLPLSWLELLPQLPLSVNVHKSAEEASTYVACGDF